MSTIFENNFATSQGIDFSDFEPVFANNTNENWYVALLKSGGHTRIEKTQNPIELINAAPIRDGTKLWKIGVIVDIGPHENHADKFISFVSGKEKQVRGVISRACQIDRLAKHFNLTVYGDFNVILNNDNANAIIFGQ